MSSTSPPSMNVLYPNLSNSFEELKTDDELLRHFDLVFNLSPDKIDNIVTEWGRRKNIVDFRESFKSLTRAYMVRKKSHWGLDEKMGS